MAQLITLAELRQQVRLSGVLRGSNPADADLDGYINRGIRDLWDAMVGQDDGWAHASTTLATAPGVETVALPADHLRTRGLFRPVGNLEPEALQTTEAAYRRRYTDVANQQADLRPGWFWYSGSSIVLRPVPTTVEQLRLVYATVAPVLTLDTDAIDQVSALGEAIIEFAAAQAQTDRARRADHQARAREMIARHVEGLPPRSTGPDFLFPMRRW